MRTVFAFAIVLSVFASASHSYAADPLSEKDFQALFKDLKEDLYSGLSGKVEAAVRKIADANCLGAAKALIEFIGKPSARLIPVEKRKEEILKLIDKFMHLAGNQGGGLSQDDFQKVKALQAELSEINGRLFRENAVRRLAAELLAGFTQTEACEHIVNEAIKNKSWRVRLGLIEALAKIPGEKAAAALKQALSDDDPAIRASALESMIERGEGALEIAMTGAADEFWQVRAAAIAAIGNLGEISAVEFLISLLKKEQGRLVGDVAESLWLITGKRMDPDPELWTSWWANKDNRDRAAEVATARKKIASKDPAVKASGILEMVRFGSSLAMPVAKKAILSDSEPVREAAITAFEKLGEHDAVDTLITALERKEEPLKKRIDQALKSLTGCTLDNEADADYWREWWQKNRAKVVKAAPAPVDQQDGGQHQKTAVRFYGIPTNSRNIMFVIDVSGSMNEPAKMPEGVSIAPPMEKDPVGSGPAAATRIEMAKWELKRAIATLSEDSQFNVIYYSDGVNLFNAKGMVTANAAGKSSAFAFVSKLKAIGATNIHDALAQAFSLAGDEKNEQKNLKAGVDTIFFLSDGMPTVGEVLEPDRILEVVRERNQHRRVIIHTICILSSGKSSIASEEPGKMRAFMSALAEQNGGKYVER